MKHNYKKNFLLFLVTGAGLCCMNYSSGTALNGQSVSGAPFGSGYCNNCHSGGNWSPTASIQLLSGGVPVTGNYVPGWNYTVRITRSASASLPANGGFGFQITSVRDATNTNINTWGTPPSMTANRLLSGRNYIEHTQKIPKATTIVDIPWTAPAAGSGTVRFYMALNTVNGNGANSGDHPITTTAAFTEAPLPVTWLYFNGKHQNGSNLLEWGTANEENVERFILEKSSDGVKFEALATVAPVETPEFAHHYSYTDLSGGDNSFYRISQKNFSGEVEYFKTIQVESNRYLSTRYYADHSQLVVQLSEEDAAEAVQVALYTLDGKVLASRASIAGAGSQLLRLERPQVGGIYVLHVRSGSRSILSEKISL